jgi:predicted RNase H-like HicB family nuclease
MLKIEIEREDDGRWIAEIPALPGALVYGATMIEAQHKIEALALRMIANRIENGEPSPIEMNRLFVSP